MGGDFEGARARPEQGAVDTNPQSCYEKRVMVYDPICHKSDVIHIIQPTGDIQHGVEALIGDTFSSNVEGVMTLAPPACAVLSAVARPPLAWTSRGIFSELAVFAIVEGIALALPAGFVFFLTRTPLRDFLESFLTVGAAELVLALGTGGAASGIGGGFAAFSRAATALRRYMSVEIQLPRHADVLSEILELFPFCFFT